MKLSNLAFSAATFLTLSTSAFATTNSIVFVSTMDKGSTAPMATDHGLGMALMKMPSDMGLQLSTNTVPAGNVTFKFKNSSHDLVHEMLVLPYVEGTNLPYDDKQVKINEDKAGSLGEVSETDPVKSGELKLSLKSGKYVLVCNLPGHFANGMWTLLTVK